MSVYNIQDHKGSTIYTCESIHLAKDSACLLSVSHTRKGQEIIIAKGGVELYVFNNGKIIR